MWDDRSDRSARPSQSDPASEKGRALLRTADASHGMTNLATVPRAGNISTDTRAGSDG